MKKLLLLTLFTTNLYFGQAQNYSDAVGVRLGNGGENAIGNAISFKHFFNNKASAKIMFDYSDNLTLGLLLEINKPIKNAANLNWFYGAGAYVGLNAEKTVTSRKLLGAQGSVGLDYKFANAPINIELDCKPELNFIDEINLELFNFGLSLRYVFSRK
ncbi:MAG: hypothetical protein EPO57_04350 [Chitinophagaceae bacterium]|nr:MAG: hypothetical protein EPO57_04350 [Chitinophagaceae bacterium]